MGVCGYLMFGRSVTDEISRDLLFTEGYNVTLTRTGMWMLVVSPITKFALSSRPLNIMLEIILDVEPSVLSPSTYRKRRRSSGTHSALSGATGGSLEHGDVAPVEPGSIGALSRKATILVAERMLLVLAAVFLAIMVPDFGLVMSLLGSLIAFGLCVIAPLAAYMTITGHYRKFDLALLITAAIMGVWGTVACILDEITE